MISELEQLKIANEVGRMKYFFNISIVLDLTHEIFFNFRKRYIAKNQTKSQT